MAKPSSKPEITHMLVSFHTHCGQQVAAGGCLPGLKLLQVGPIEIACSMVDTRMGAIPLGIYHICPDF